jgi:hypothetical protein
MFKDVCKGWNCARSGETRPFDPWILKSEFIGESGVVTFASIADMCLFEVSFPALAGKRTRLIGCGVFGSLVALDCRDWSNALMLNRLSPRKHIRLPQLPKWSQMATLQACILCLETTAGAESFLVITFFWLEKCFAVLGSLPVSIWHLGSQSDWTTLPSEDFWCSSSKHMQIYSGQDLSAPPHPVGLQLSWVIGMGNSSLLEDENRLFFVVLEEKETEVV